jgi:hypothetical protein
MHWRKTIMPTYLEDVNIDAYNAVVAAHQNMEDQFRPTEALPKIRIQDDPNLLAAYVETGFRFPGLYAEQIDLGKDFIDNLSPNAIAFVVCHEAAHDAMNDLKHDNGVEEWKEELRADVIAAASNPHLIDAVIAEVYSPRINQQERSGYPSWESRIDVLQEIKQMSDSERKALLDGIKKDGSRDFSTIDATFKNIDIDYTAEIEPMESMFANLDLSGITPQQYASQDVSPDSVVAPTGVTAITRDCSVNSI